MNPTLFASVDFVQILLKPLKLMELCGTHAQQRNISSPSFFLN